jgi:hypothetical protein
VQRHVTSTHTKCKYIKCTNTKGTSLMQRHVTSFRVVFVFCFLVVKVRSATLCHAIFCCTLYAVQRHVFVLRLSACTNRTFYQYAKNLTLHHYMCNVIQQTVGVAVSAVALNEPVLPTAPSPYTNLTFYYFAMLYYDETKKNSGCSSFCRRTT